MNRRALIWGLAWLLSLAGISLFGGPVSYGFFAVMTMLPLISWLYLLLAYLAFRIYQEPGTRNMTAGESVPFYFTLVNEFPLVFAGVRVRFFTGFSTITDLSDETEYELFPHTGIRKETNIVCHYRGEYEIGIRRVELRDYLCMFRISYRNPETLRVQVKPRQSYLDSLRTLDSSLTVRDSAFYRATPDIPAREYQPGDDPRKISWAQTARFGIPMVREEIGEEKQGVGILLDLFRASDEPEQYLPAENLMLETVLALAWFFASKSIPVREYHVSSEGVQTVPDLNSYQSFYERIAAVSFDPDATLERLGTTPEQSREFTESRVIFLVTGSLSAAVLSLAEKHASNDTNVIIYLAGEAGRNQRLALENQPRISLIALPPETDLKEVL